MKFEVKNRITGYVQFTADIETNSESRSIQLRLAVKWGVDNGADLSGAELRGADLCGADLSGAYLRGARLSHNKTIISCCLGCYEMYLHQSNGVFMIKAGCRYFTIKAAKQHWSEANIESWTEKTKEYGERQLRMLEFLESEAKALGWKEEEK